MFVVNNIAYIEELNERFNLSQRGIVIAHGGLSSDQLNDNLNKLRTNEAWGVLTTRILEVGYDLPELEAVVILGLPDKRALIQIIGRIARNYLRKTQIFLFLRKRVNLEKEYLEDKKALQHYLFEKPVAPVVVNYNTTQCAQLMLLLAPLFEIHSMQTIQDIYYDVPEVPRLLRRVSRELFAKGQLQLVSNDEFYPTAETAFAFFAINLRGALPQYQIYQKEKETIAGVPGTRNERLIRVNARQFLKKLLPGQSYLFNSKYYVCEEVYNNKIFVREAKTLYEKTKHADNIIGTRILMTTKRRTQNPLGVELQEVIRQLYPKQGRVWDKGTNNLEDVNLTPEQKIVIPLLTVSCAIPLGSISQAVANLLAAYLKKAIEITIDIPTKEIELIYSTESRQTALSSNPSSLSRKKSDFLHIIDPNSTTGNAELIYDKLKPILLQTWDLVNNCACRGEGCKQCCGIDYNGLPKEQWPQKHAKVVHILESMLFSQVSLVENSTGKKAYAYT